MSMGFVLGGVVYLLLKMIERICLFSSRESKQMEVAAADSEMHNTPTSSTGKAEGSNSRPAKRRKFQRVYPEDELRCRRSDGKGWRCIQERMEGSIYCEHHNSTKSKISFRAKPKKRRLSSPKRLLSAKSPRRLTARPAKSDDEEEDRTGGEMFNGTKEYENGNSLCHQCQRNDQEKVIYCSKCNLKCYCSPCIKAWYPLLSESGVAVACPFCRGNCNCKACLHTCGLQMETVKWDEDVTQEFLKYLLIKLLPCLEQVHNEQRDELKVERSLQRTSHVKMEKAVISADQCLHCDNCSTSIVDYHRSCPACGYRLCITCCRELRLKCGSVRGAQAKQQDGKEEEEPESVEIQGSKLEKPVQSCAWAASSDGSIKCPPLSLGGCGGCELDLKTLFEPDWIAKLAMDAEMESYNTRTEHDLLHCSICDLGGGGGGGGDVKKKLRLASHRNGEKNDNYLYCPSRHNVEEESEGLVHFQKHWLRGEPVIVCNVVLEGGSGLSWEPMVMWRAVRETMKNKFEKNTRTVAAIDCLDWQEVDVNIHQFFTGYKDSKSHKDGWPQLLRLKDWPPSSGFEEQLPKHRAEFLATLPFQQYMNPKTGFLNLAAKLPENMTKPNLGPRMYIANGLKEELLKGDSVIKLHKDIADSVYVLMHTTEVQLLEEQQQIVKDWIQKSNHKGESKWSSLGAKYDVDRTAHTRKSVYGGALWDIFRRQDTPKLEAYLRKHWEEFCIPDHWVVDSVVHPIHDQAVFLTSDHKRKLKEEYDVEAWTFEQNEGEAVLIPAGCSYQVRNLKSCIHMVLEFVSPESLQECLQLTSEFRCLPKSHHANKDKLEVKKMIVYGATKVVHSLRQIRDSCDN